MLLVRRKPTIEARKARTVYSRPRWQIKPAQVIRGNMRKCLACGGVPRVNFNLGTVTGFQPKSKPYQHLENCSQKGKF